MPMPARPVIVPALHSLVGGTDARRLAGLTRDPLVVRLHPAGNRLGGELRLVTDVGAGIRLA